MRSVLCAAVILLAAACSRSPVNDLTAPTGPMLARGLSVEPDSLDPQKARVVESQELLRDICEGLTTFDKNAGAAPGVATRWSVSPDGRTYTLNLRPEARWSNGDRIVAADFVTALRRLVDPTTASSYAQTIDVVANASDIIAGRKPPVALGVSAPNEATVVVELTSPAAYLPGLLAHPSTCPVHRPTLAAHPLDYAKPGVMPSSGAFVLKEWVPGSHVLLIRNHNYWNDAATRLAAVKYVPITDENGELTRYRAGELNVTFQVPRGQFDWIRAHLASQLHITARLATYYYGFNLGRAPFKDQPGLRRALSLVIDRDRLAGQVLRAGEPGACGWIPPGVNNYTSQSFDYCNTPMAQRIAEARRLYAQAGYSDAKPLHFELRYNSSEVHDKLAIAVASMWKEALGIDVRLTAVEFKSLLQDIDNGDVEMFRSSWSGDYNDAYAFAEFFKSDSGINSPHYRSAEYDSLLAAAAAEVDLTKRRELLQSAERVVLRDHPVIPLYFYVSKRLVKPEVEGWYSNVMDVVYSKDLGLRPQPR